MTSLAKRGYFGDTYSRNRYHCRDGFSNALRFFLPHFVFIVRSRADNMSRLRVEFAEKLARLGLGEYDELLTSNGFGSWESVQRITETDMERMQLKLGSRRKLLRAIATDQGYPVSQSLTDSRTAKDFSSANSASKNQRMVLGHVPSSKRICQYSSGRNTISPTLLQTEFPIFINCSDAVRS
jgi:hypothetical protein